MFLFHRPSESEIIQYLLDQRDAPFSYPDVGASNRELPAGFNVDRRRVRLGIGSATFDRARLALSRWKMYPSPLTDLCFADRPVTPGTVVAAMINVGPIWSLNPCRIVYAVDDETPDGVRRFGFAIGTLPDHAEQGEERFLVEWRRADDTVWYDLLAFSRPRHVLARCLYWYTRWLQHRFQRLSASGMQAACAIDPREVPSPGLTRSGTAITSAAASWPD